MLYPFVPWSADECIRAFESQRKKPHQGVAGKNPALHPGIVWSNSTTALGLRGLGLENRVRSRCTGKERDSESGLDYFGARYMASTMGRFMSADPSRLSVFFTNPQSWNRYSYVYNNPLRLTDDNGKWPTDIHNQIIDNSFPNLTAAQRQILKNVSAQQDSILGGGQANSASFEHAMRGPNQTVEQAQGQFNDFVSGTETSAQTAEWTFWLNDPDNAGSLSDEALARFGEALHAVLDQTSPAHAGFQKWDWRNPSLVIAHHNAEKTINPQQMQNAISAARNAFNSTFGMFGFTIAPPPPEPKPHVTHKICYTDDKGKQVCQ
jgi:RHS repeat-associated protein